MLELKESSCFNLGVAGDVPYYRISELPLLINSEPDLVMIEVNPRSLTELSNLHNFDENLYIRYGIAGIHQDESQISSWSNFINREHRDYIITDNFEYYEFRNNYRQKIIDNRLDYLFEDFIADAGILTKSDKNWTIEEIEERKAKLPDFLVEPSWSPSSTSYNFKCLEIIIDQLILNNITVGLYTVSIDPSVVKNLPEGHWDEFNTSVNLLVNSKNLTYLDSLFEVWESDDFRDLTHLHNNGIKKYNDLLIQELKSRK